MNVRIIGGFAAAAIALCAWTPLGAQRGEGGAQS